MHIWIQTIGILLLFSCNQNGESGITQKIIKTEQANIISHEINLKETEIHFHHKDTEGNIYKNHGELKKQLESQGLELNFAINGGMYKKDLSPQGLYIEKGIQYSALNSIEDGYGNFYLQPNGIFYISEGNNAGITQTNAFSKSESIKYATQSGPMLIIDGKMHGAFQKGSTNLHIRNGVGILPNGNLLFAISKDRINFYDFAQFFKENKCHNALYLDGFVSRMYLPSKNWVQKDGLYAIIIATQKKN